MATWGAHIRIAEQLLQRDDSLDPVHFLVGNVGPDCGVPNEDWSAFSPPKPVSHWMDEQGQIEPERFREAYLQYECDDCKWRDSLSEGDSDEKRRAFLLGYYAHLLTDIAWGRMYHEKKAKDPHYRPLREDKAFIWKIKEDWYDLDHLYFRNYPNGLFHSVFLKIESFPDYLAYYPQGGIARQVRYIQQYYSQPERNLDREYVYLTEDEMDRFVAETTETLSAVLRKMR